MKFRSILFSPADNPKRVRNALEEGLADIVVADLEDGVAPNDKPAARKAVAKLLADIESAPAVRAVRINAYPSPDATKDLDAIIAAAPDMIVVPKVESVAAVTELSERLDKAGGDTKLFLILETARGVMDAVNLARASQRTVAIAIGAEDLAADAGMRRSASNYEVQTARSLVVLAAAAVGVAAVDMITADLRDTERVSAEALDARNMGFRGKMCIHPLQVELVHAAFQPTERELAWAAEIVTAAKSAGVEKGGVVVVNGSMIDVPLLEQARRILSDAS